METDTTLSFPFPCRATELIPLFHIFISQFSQYPLPRFGLDLELHPQMGSQKCLTFEYKGDHVASKIFHGDLCLFDIGEWENSSSVIRLWAQ